MCTVVLSFEPGERVPLLLLGIRDEVTDRPWLPPARHWPGSPLIGGLDKQAGGTWLAVDPDIPRVACLLNGRGAKAVSPRPTGPDRPPASPRPTGPDRPPVSPRPTGPDRPPGVPRRTRGELPLRAATDGAGMLKELADDPGALAVYEPFHLVCAETGVVRLLGWDGERPACRDLEPGTHLLTNVGHAYPAAPGATVTEPKAVAFGAKFAASRPSGDPALPPGQAWGDWLAYAAGDGLDPGDPSAIIARRDLPDGRVWGTTSLSLVALAADGLRYDFRTYPSAITDWYPVIVTA